MKRRVILDCVEIPHRIPFQKQPKAPEPPPSPTSTESAGPRKRRKTDVRLSSPTVSDFEDGRMDSYTAAAFSQPSTLGTSGSSLTLDAILPVGSKIYEINDDEVSEDEELVVPGETDASDASREDDDDTVPVRVLRDFSIYDGVDHTLLHIAQLLAVDLSTAQYRASGLVAPWFAPDSNPSDDDSNGDDANDDVAPRVKLSTILKFDVHSFSDDTNSMDSNIYIQTKHAWYVLDLPSEAYRAYYVPFWIQHRSLHLMLNTVLRTPRMAYDKFIDTLRDDAGSEDALYSVAPDEDVQACLEMLGRTLTEDDIQSEDVKIYVVGSLEDICRENSIRFKSSPFLCEYLKNEDFDTFKEPKSKAAKSQAKVFDKELEVLKHRNRTIVTRVVGRIAQDLFKGSLEVTGSDIHDHEVATIIADTLKAHHNDPKSMVWDSAPLEGQVYASVIVDGVKYSVGDDVMVNPGDDENASRDKASKSAASSSTNSYANRLWFCRICYFFEKVVEGELVKMFHGQWYVHGSKTILQEISHSKALYFMHECADNPIASIFKKCNVRMMGSEEVEIPDDARCDSNDFHCSLMYDEESTEFLDIPDEDTLAGLFEDSPPNKPCMSCGMEYQRKKLATCSSSFQHLSIFGVDFHLYDCIYIRPTASGTTGLFNIAQITKIDHTSKPLEISVRYFKRDVSDERRLYLETKVRTLDDVDRIEGLCYIRQLSTNADICRWVQHDDHFYISEDDINKLDRTCRLCHKERDRALKHSKELLQKNGPISCLELFSGAGGLGTGLDMSGYVTTKWAVEFSPSAAATYSANHADATVYCQDSSSLLQHAINTDAGKGPPPLISNQGTRLPLMPRKYEVDMISGGPPCQSFSRANHNPKADDIRSTLSANMLSYVEHYEPQYFLLENVGGFISHSLKGTRSKVKRSIEGGIEAGMVKFVMRTLIALGYQVRCKLVQAGQYGAPQSRHRIIFWGAKRGIPIPDFPVPIYAVPKMVHRCTLPTGFLHPVSRSINPNVMHQCAPLPAVTVDDAIGDLAKFDWENPHELVDETAHDIRDRKKRRKEGIPGFRAVTEKGERPFLVGFPDGAEYATVPKNRYQTWIRQRMGGDQLVSGHYTKTFSSRLVEATASVPLRPGASHRDLPATLVPNHARPGAKQGRHPSFYGRVGGESQFKCAMTALAPNVKEAWPLHPNQKRIFTVRECARAQGFPDHYDFKSADEDKPQKVVNNQIRQIGNAVPVPLALHLGKALGKALVKLWDKKEREGSPVV